MTSPQHAQPLPEPLEPEEAVDGVPVLAQVRALEPARRSLPVAQTAAVAATCFVAGAATVVALHHRATRRRPLVRRRARRRDGETLSIVGTRSFLLDIHLLGRGE
jgi:hypothetical protein